MPIYEFKCEKCLRITVASLPISSQRKTYPCQFCGDDADRMISATNFRIKGYSAKNGYSKEK